MLRAVRKTVVKVLTVSDPADYDQPWQTEGVTTSIGSGVIVETKRGPRILTNAHVVEDHVFVEVRRYGRARKFIADVEGVGDECDLALLRVDDAEFFRGIEPLPIGNLPLLGDHVTVLGFPIGGDRLSVTEGVVSRIEMLSYEQSQRRLLGLQIDAAINSGNSGGPVVMDGRLVGIAFQALDEAENIGYVIATPVVEHFLRDMDDGRVDGFPHLGVVTQRLESRAHRRALGLGRARRGVLVTRVICHGSSWGILEPGDVLLSVGGTAVAPDGTVPFGRGTRINFSWLIVQHHVGEELDLEVLREGKRFECTVTLEPPRYLVPEDDVDAKPAWYLFAGLLFVPLTRAYLRTWGDDWPSQAPGELVGIYEREIRTPDLDEVVVLQKVLADEANRGYHAYESVVIESVDGVPIRSLCELVGLVESSDDSYVVFETRDHEQIVIDRNLAEARGRAIRERYGLPSDRSTELPVRCKGKGAA